MGVGTEATQEHSGSAMTQDRRVKTVQNLGRPSVVESGFPLNTNRGGRVQGLDDRAWLDVFM